EAVIDRFDQRAGRGIDEGARGGRREERGLAIDALLAGRLLGIAPGTGELVARVRDGGVALVGLAVAVEARPGLQHLRAVLTGGAVLRGGTGERGIAALAVLRFGQSDGTERERETDDGRGAPAETRD